MRNFEMSESGYFINLYARSVDISYMPVLILPNFNMVYYSHTDGLRIGKKNCSSINKKV